MKNNGMFRKICMGVSIFSAIAMSLLLFAAHQMRISYFVETQGNWKLANQWGYLILAVLPLAMLTRYEIIWAKNRNNPDKAAENRIQQKVYPIYMLALLLFTWAMLIFALLQGKDISSQPTLYSFLFGLMVVVLSNPMGKLQRNHTIGIRTPWTLSSEFIWNKTHRLGGYLGVIGGFTMIVGGMAAFFQQQEAFAHIGMAIGSTLFGVIPTLYSAYLAFQLRFSRQE